MNIVTTTQERTERKARVFGLVRADQTEACPPCWWTIGTDNVGVCKKCGATKQFEGPLAECWAYGRGNGKKAVRK